MARGRLLGGILIFILLACICTPNLYPQQKEFELWTGVKAKSQIFGSLDVSVEEQLRFNNNASRIDKHFTELGLGYDVSGHIELAAYYRFVNLQELSGSYSFHHKLFADLQLKKDLRRFRVSFRSRYQTKYIDLANSEEGYLLKDYSRNKISLKYDHRKLPLSFSFANEWFYMINKVRGSQFDKYRFAFGLDYIAGEKSDFSISYKIDKEFNVGNPANTYILQVGYSRDF